jgi:hypothetical protein
VKEAQANNNKEFPAIEKITGWIAKISDKDVSG